MNKKIVQPDEADPRQRVEGFGEVISGYSEDQALLEARRCLQCKDPACSSGCPVGIDIKAFIRRITERDYTSAYATIREKNNFASICGRICPAEYQCRRACVFTKKREPFAASDAINIGFLERFAGDYGMAHPAGVPPQPDNRLSKFKVAVVGSGPAGLCCAGELARSGVEVTIFEGLHALGGVMRYGIPAFRLPRDILDYEINYLLSRGVVFVPNTLIGRTKSIEELFAEGFRAVFLGLGAGIPGMLGIPGENLGNVYSANEFLTRINLMSAYRFPEYHTPINIGKHIAVIGGGNTAMDAARAALRMQKIAGLEPRTTIYYRRTEVEMPARKLEIAHAKEEGVRFEFPVAPRAFGAGAQGVVKTLTLLRCELGAPDDSGRRKPIPIEGSDFEVPCETAVIAVGLQANRLLTGVTPALKLDKAGDIVVNSQTMETSMPGVFAGGDIVGGEGTVIEAMGMAKKASSGIVKYLQL